MGLQGQSCYKACLAISMNCNANIVTNNSAAIFASLGVSCKPDSRDWWAEDQPNYVSDPSDPNYGDCLGYTNVPQDVMCGGQYPTTQRLCHCVAPLAATGDMAQPFGIGISGGQVTTTEIDVFAWQMPAGNMGVMTHFWITGDNTVIDRTVIRYYIDGEQTASIQYNAGLASGTGFADATSPWGTKWIGKGAKDGSWFNNIRIPFQKSVRVSWQNTQANAGGMYIILRGLPNLPISFSGIPVPSTARLNLIVQNVNMQPLQYIDLVNIPAGTKGLYFFHTLAVTSGNLNFLEGCYHSYSPPNQAFPGTLLSTGTEDYFDSGWYFNAGEFRFPVAGYTHYAQSGNTLTFSAYRFHEMDPLAFNNGFRMSWRNGDAIDPQTGLKCFIQNGGNVVGSPTVSNVTTYSWVYTW